jgi:sec-independent protein translocase protein TatA
MTVPSSGGGGGGEEATVALRNPFEKEARMPSIGPMELIVVLVIALVVLGPKRLPDAGRSLGRGMREFRESVTGVAERSEPAPARNTDVS